MKQGRSRKIFKAFPYLFLGLVFCGEYLTAQSIDIPDLKGDSGAHFNFLATYEINENSKKTISGTVFFSENNELSFYLDETKSVLLKRQITDGNLAFYNLEVVDTNSNSQLIHAQFSIISSAGFDYSTGNQEGKPYFAFALEPTS